MVRLGRWLVNLVVLYGIVAGGMLLARRSLIYPFDETSAWTGDLPGVLIETISRDDGSNLTVWAAEPAEGKPVIFYFMGNVGHLEAFDPQFREILTHGYGLVAMAYRGGGGASGKPSEAGLKQDARLLWNNLPAVLRVRIPENQRIIYGFSLGTGIAVDLASSTNPAAVILEAPFTRLCKVIEFTTKILPACRLMWDEFYPSIEQVSQINAPVLVLHGEDDNQVPVEMGRKIAQTAGDAELVIYPGGRHNNLRLHGAITDAMNFIERKM